MTGNAPVFIVDDDPAARDALRLLVSVLGWEARAFPSGSDCLGALADQTPHCVITDLSMPGMNGAELAERLASRGPPVPVVVITGFEPEAPLVARARTAGGRIVHKPYREVEIETVLKDARAAPPPAAPVPAAAAVPAPEAPSPYAIADGDFRRMFDTLPEPRAILSPDLRLLAANECYCRVTLTRIEDIVGRYLFDIFPDNPDDPSGRLEAQAMFRRVIETRTPDRVIQKYSLVRPAGEGGGMVERYWSTSAVPVLAPDGALKYIVVRPEDVTEYLRSEGDAAAPRRRSRDALMSEMEIELYRRAQEVQAANEALRNEIGQRAAAERERERAMAELARSNEDLAQFAYVVSHDLQAPLAAIIQFTDILRRQLGPGIPADAIESLAYLGSGAQRMSDLIRDLLTLARAGRHQERIVEVAAGDVLDAARAQLEAEIARTGATVEAEGTLPRIAGNPVELVQLFQNLVGNALKFQAPGVVPRVVVSAARDGAHWRFTVADNGIGIAPADQAAVFAVFKRLHRAEQYPGTGIGLALCRKIVERLGGRVWVESEPGRGSRFHFTVPASLPQRAAAG